MKKVLVFPIVLLIKIYQLIISPVLGHNCRYNPTCSEYSKMCFQKHGLFYGFYYSFKRIIRCHPWGNSGYDPIP